MKTRFIILFLLIFGRINASVTESEAKEILKNHFISQREARVVYPDLPKSLTINFSKEFLKKNLDAWLVPVKLGPKNFSYMLVKAAFEYEAYSIKKADTLTLEKAKSVLLLFDKLKLNFPKDKTHPFKYFFRVKDYSPYSGMNKQHKIVACEKERFVIIDWPNGVEFAVANGNSVSFITKNKKDETEIGYRKFPQGVLADNQTIFILTLLNIKS